jgi:hypothetical protein
VRDGHAEAALAFGQGSGGTQWAVGGAWNYANVADAEAKAAQNCQSRGPNCRTVRTFKNTCIALAVQDGANGYAWQVDADIEAARQQALNACTKYGRACTVKQSFCDATPTAPATPVAAPTTAATPVPAPANGGLTACQRFPNLC